jgi:hypothetical protein
MEGKFKLGRLLATAGVMGKVDLVNQMKAVNRHMKGEWGEVRGNDAELNNWGVEHEDRILSKYTYDGVTFWIITEWDRSATTLLLPEEY